MTERAMPRRAFHVLAREACFTGHARLDRVTVRHTLYAGGWGRPIEREVLDRGHVAVVLPYDPERDTVVLIEQFRVGAIGDPAGAWTLEAVAGVIDGADTAEATVRREAIEEAGCRLDALVPVARVLVSPGCMTETFEIYCGRTSTDGIGGIHGLAHEGEDIRVLVVPFADALAMLEAGRIRVSHTVIALQWLALNRARVGALWHRGTG